MNNVIKVFGSIILLAGMLIVCIAIIGQVKTLRYPRLTFDPTPQPSTYARGGFRIEADGAYLKSESQGSFRAFSPSVDLNLYNFPDDAVSVVVENIHPQAVLETDSVTAIKRGFITEIINGLTRRIHVSAPGSRVKLSWKMPIRSTYRFGVMGDSGGDRELEWGLKRLAEYDVDFILHMGDLYYSGTEIPDVHRRLNNSKVPVYVAIGNHDFHGPKGNTYDEFSRNIGPFNSAFQLLNTCFINLDTATDMYPAGDGYRGQFLQNLAENKILSAERCEKVVFTHKPFTDGLKADTIHAQDHSLTGYQAEALREWFKKMGDITLLSGHIHDDLEFSLPGIKTYVAGSAMGAKDLMAGKPVSKYLIGEIEEGKTAQFVWIPGNMPMEYHCSKRAWRGLEANNPELLAELTVACEGVE